MKPRDNSGNLLTHKVNVMFNFIRNSSYIPTSNKLRVPVGLYHNYSVVSVTFISAILVGLPHDGLNL